MKSRAETSADKRFAKRRHEHVCASEPNFSGMRWEDEPERSPWLAMKAGVLVALALLGGCATNQVAQQPERALAPGNVALVTVRYTPHSASEAYGGRIVKAAEGAGAGAVKGALMGAFVGLAIPLGLNLPAKSVGPIFRYVGPYLIVGGALVGGTIGATSGAWKGISKPHANYIQPRIKRAQPEMDLQGPVAERVLVAVADLPAYRVSQVFGEPSYAALKDEGFDSVLEIGVSANGNFQITLRARLVPLAAQDSAATREFSCAGNAQEELDACYRSLSEQLVSFAFSRT